MNLSQQVSFDCGVNSQVEFRGGVDEFWSKRGRASSKSKSVTKKTKIKQGFPRCGRRLINCPRDWNVSLGVPCKSRPVAPVKFISENSPFLMIYTLLARKTENDWWPSRFNFWDHALVQLATVFTIVEHPLTCIFHRCTSIFPSKSKFFLFLTYPLVA